MKRVCIWCAKGITVKLSLIELLSFSSMKDRSVCDECFDQFERIDQSNSCTGCARPQENKELCWDCKRWKSIYPNLQFNHQAMFSYNHFGKEWMERFKFLGDVRAAHMIASELNQKMKKYKKTHVIVPVSASKTSLAERGFNQVEVLLKTADVSYQTVFLNQVSPKKQSSKNRQQRMMTKQPFFIDEQKEDFVYNKKILLVDDVYTTGRTLFHAGDSLRDAKAKSVETFSIFR